MVQAHSYRLPSCAVGAIRSISVGRTQAVGRHHARYRQYLAHGFMVGNKAELGRGERDHPPARRRPDRGAFDLGTEDRAGFQFERIIRQDDFTTMIAALQPNPRLRK
jgi:hypothetical protein